MDIPSTIVYILEMITIIRHKQFSQSSFYKLFFIRAVADILSLVPNSLGNLLPAFFGQQLLPIYSTVPNWTIVLLTFFTKTFVFQVTNIVTILILLNRFTAIAFPLRHKMLWKKNFWRFIVFVLVLPMLIIVPIMRMRTIIVFYDSNSFLFGEKDPEQGNLWWMSFTKAISSSIFLLLALLINISTLIAYKRSKKVALNSPNSVQIEKKLLIYALLTFSGHAIIAIFMILIGSKFFKEYKALVYIHSPWINDLCSLVLSSWLLFCTCDTFRQQFFKDFCPKCIYPTQQNVTNTTPIVIIATNQNRLFQNL
ncbi:hypothetical protein niasHS_007087 [Heterodera schachtii]|uniref:Serpentine receptor class gamma n=1 Tax=Heterodera schachtii TaxID=97005 RepID=A0ABD2JFK0_HETSC